jgi:hypothetical protein
MIDLPIETLKLYNESLIDFENQLNNIDENCKKIRKDFLSKEFCTLKSKPEISDYNSFLLKFKPYLNIETTIASLLIVGVGVALYFIFTKFIFKEGFFGSDDPVDTKEQNSKQVKVDEVERQLQDRITKINTNLTALKKRMDDADIVKNNKPTNLAIAIQNNILAVKEAMMKIIAGLVVQTKMNNGALNVVSQTTAFQQGINDSLKKFK